MHVREDRLRRAGVDDVGEEHEQRAAAVPRGEVLAVEPFHRDFVEDPTLTKRYRDLVAVNELNFDVQLTLARLEVPECRLGGEGEFYEPRLGWNTWLKDGEIGMALPDPVLVDLLDGTVYDIPEENWSRSGGAVS